MANEADLLGGRLKRLLDLTTSKADREAVEELLRRSDDGALRILVAGEAKRGKSTLVNALLGRTVLPSGVVPLTAIPTSVVFGDPPQARVRFHDGSSEAIPVTEIETFVTEVGNPDNVRGVAEVVVEVPVELLAAGVELVDTPGTGSVYRHNTEAAIKAYERMDAAVLVLTADPPISYSERSLVETLRGLAVRTWFVLNKIDRLRPEEVQTALEFTRGVLGDLLGESVEVWPVSALEALDVGATTSPANRFPDFADAFGRYVTGGSGRDLSRSLASHAERIAIAVKDRDDATLAAASITDQSERQALDHFASRLRRVEQERIATQAHADTMHRQLLAETDEAAAVLARRGKRDLQAQLRTYLESAKLPPNVMEREGMNLLTQLMREDIDVWRSTWRQHLDEKLAVAEVELSERLDRHIAAVRDAATTLFDVNLSTYSVDKMLIDGDRFIYQFQPPPGQYDTMAATFRRILPARLTRRWVERYLVRRGLLLYDQQVGRARSHFQRDLADTARELHASLDRQFEDGAGALVAAINAGTSIRQSAQPEGQELLRRLRDRSEIARLLAAEFSSLAA